MYRPHISYIHFDRHSTMYRLRIVFSHHSCMNILPDSHPYMPSSDRPLTTYRPRNLYKNFGPQVHTYRLRIVSLHHSYMHILPDSYPYMLNFDRHSTTYRLRSLYKHLMLHRPLLNMYRLRTVYMRFDRLPPMYRQHILS